MERWGRRLYSATKLISCTIHRRREQGGEFKVLRDYGKAATCSASISSKFHR